MNLFNKNKKIYDRQIYKKIIIFVTSLLIYYFILFLSGRVNTCSLFFCV